MILQPQTTTNVQLDPRDEACQALPWSRWMPGLDGAPVTTNDPYIPEACFGPTAMLLEAYRDGYLGLRSHVRYSVSRQATEEQIAALAATPDAWLHEPALNRMPYLVAMLGSVAHVRTQQYANVGALTTILIAKHQKAGRFSTLQWTVSTKMTSFADAVEATGLDGIGQAVGPWAVQPTQPRLIFRRGKAERIDRRPTTDFATFVQRSQESATARFGRRQAQTLASDLAQSHRVVVAALANSER